MPFFCLKDKDERQKTNRRKKGHIHTQGKKNKDVVCQDFSSPIRKMY